MPTLDDIVRSQSPLTSDDAAWLHALVADWQIIADLAFSDLVLWVPDAEEKGLWAVAQIRPTTGSTTLLGDLTGRFVPAERDPDLQQVVTGSVAARQRQEGDGVRRRVVPVRRGGPGAPAEPVAALTLHDSVGHRATSRLELTYRSCAEALVAMIGRGAFPAPDAPPERAESLRVGDGFVKLATDGTVEYASPNAMSAYRRLGVPGDLMGQDLSAVTAAHVARTPTERSAVAALRGRAPAEVEVTAGPSSLVLRVIPLARHGRPDGAVVLLRDVTELRVRERELVSKEATIREIHHRVKNNLQTVAALLRLQARRMEVPEARAALEEAVQRVGSIALVHETLSQSFDERVDFDEIADRLLASSLEVHGGAIRGERVGTFGSLGAEVATPLAMALTELVQNAAEHAYGPGTRGRLTVAVNRIRDRLRLRISDDGCGLPSDFDPARSLGLSIVTTLVEAELGGTLAFSSQPGRGTTVTISLAL